MHAAYVTNVGHYDHVLHAMSQSFEEILIVRRPEPTPEQLRKLRRVGVPKAILKVLDRRVRQPSSIPHRARLLGLGDALITSTVQSGRKIPASVFRRATDYSARRAARLTADVDVLHFVEGLGHRALRRNSYDLTICERRAMHHAVFEGDFPTLGSFPHHARQDPIGDFLDFEYENATKILVYSGAAKQSFLDRGYAGDKVVVSPIGIPEQLPRIESERDKYKFAFVGRGDAYKGLDLAVASVAQLGHPYRLHVAGPMRPEVLEWLRRQPNVIYEGLLNKVQLRALYASSHLLVLPSIEAFGLAVAEAVHHGLHVVCSPETGIVEYLPPDKYTQVSGRDPERWATVIAELVSTDVYLKSVDKVQLERQNQLPWDTAAEQLSRLYATLL